MFVLVLLEFDFTFVLVSVGVNACIQHFHHLTVVCANEFSRPEHDHSVMASCLVIRSAASGCPVTYVSTICHKQIVILPMLRLYTVQ